MRVYVEEKQREETAEYEVEDLGGRMVLITVRFADGKHMDNGWAYYRYVSGAASRSKSESPRPPGILEMTVLAVPENATDARRHRDGARGNDVCKRRAASNGYRGRPEEVLGIR